MTLTWLIINRGLTDQHKVGRTETMALGPISTGFPVMK